MHTFSHRPAFILTSFFVIIKIWAILFLIQSSTSSIRLRFAYAFDIEDLIGYDSEDQQLINDVRGSKGLWDSEIQDKELEMKAFKKTDDFDDSQDSEDMDIENDMSEQDLRGSEDTIFENDMFEQDSGSDGYNLEESTFDKHHSHSSFQNLDSIDGTQLQDIDISTKFKRGIIDVKVYENIEDWDPRELYLYPGDYKAYNFSTKSDNFELLVYISACICKYPKNMNDESSLQYLNFYQSYDNGEHFYPMEFEEGYFQSVDYTTNPNGNTSMTILFYAEFVNSTKFEKLDFFSIMFACSADDLVFQWDNGTFASLVDTDDQAAFFQSSPFNLSAATREEIMNGTKDYEMRVFLDDPKFYFAGLSRSWCAVNQDAGYLPNLNFTTFYSDTDYDFRKKFYVEGLSPSTNYIAYVTRNIDTWGSGGVIYSRISFSTDAGGVCKLVYGADFCNMVEYSVPQSASYHDDGNRTDLIELYDSYAASIYANFSKALQQTNCYAEDDMAYSPIVTCDDCRGSYKSWLCAVTFPRCKTEHKAGYKLRTVNHSRSNYVNDYVQPQSDYYEVLPCINLCWGIKRDCPAYFSFDCPDNNKTLLDSYYFLTEDTYTTCNLLGNTSFVTTNAAVHTILDLKYVILCMIVVLGTLG